MRTLDTIRRALRVAEYEARGYARRGLPTPPKVRDRILRLRAERDRRENAPSVLR